RRPRNQLQRAPRLPPRNRRALPRPGRLNPKWPRPKPKRRAQAARRPRSKSRERSWLVGSSQDLPGRLPDATDLSPPIYLLYILCLQLSGLHRAAKTPKWTRDGGTLLETAVLQVSAAREMSAACNVTTLL
ncbi:hypothetical protein IscW_ISCW006875, partial [Ixodes scapularis]